MGDILKYMRCYLPLQPAKGCQRSCFSWHEHSDQGSATAREDTSDYGNEGGLGGRMNRQTMPLLLELNVTFDTNIHNI